MQHSTSNEYKNKQSKSLTRSTKQNARSKRGLAYSASKKMFKRGINQLFGNYWTTVHNISTMFRPDKN